MAIAAIDYNTGLNNAWSNVATFVPKFVVFLLILLIGWLIAKVITKALSAVLTRVGFDKAVERGGVKKALESSKYDASDVLAKIVYYAIMLFVLSTAFGVFGPNPISDYLRAVVSYLPLVFVAILIVIIASAVAAAAKALIENSLGELSYAKILANVASGLILAFGIIAALDQLKIATNVVNAILYATLAAAVGVIVVAVGGGGIKTMSTRWEAVAQKYDEEKPRMAQAVRNAPSLKDQTNQAKNVAKTAASNGSSSNGGGATRASRH
ncbi:MAG: rane protein of unknown function [Pseudonocardiales bacterium]|nr:rane protein of unknown function [Pseudonocardiales bacterium]